MYLLLLKLKYGGIAESFAALISMCRRPRQEGVTPCKPSTYKTKIFTIKYAINLHFNVLLSINFYRLHAAVRHTTLLAGL